MSPMRRYFMRYAIWSELESGPAVTHHNARTAGNADTAVHKHAPAGSARALHPLARTGDNGAQGVVAVIAHVREVEPGCQGFSMGATYTWILPALASAASVLLPT